MPGAGFYAIHNSEIRFGADGVWYADGARIENPRIARLFAQSVERGADGGFILRVGDETAPIVVEDTPYVVTAVDVDEDDLVVSLNDDSREVVDATSLRISEDNVFYCQVRRGAERARLLRPAHYQLAEHIGETAAGGFELRLGSRVFPIAKL